MTKRRDWPPAESYRPMNDHRALVERIEWLESRLKTASASFAVIEHTLAHQTTHVCPAIEWALSYCREALRAISEDSK